MGEVAELHTAGLNNESPIYTLDLAQSGEVTSVTGLDLDVSITLDLCHNRIYINFHPLVVILMGSRP